MSELPPSFDVVTTDDAIAIIPNKEQFSHARTTGQPKPIDPLTCEICGETKKTTSGLGSHKRYKHQPQLSDIKENDMIRVAYRTSTKPTYDTKANMWLFPDDIKFPDGFRFHSIHQMDVLLRRPDGQPMSGISIILVKEGKK